MRKFESSQKDESRAQSADSSKAYRKRGDFYCIYSFGLEFCDLMWKHSYVFHQYAVRIICIHSVK